MHLIRTFRRDAAEVPRARHFVADSLQRAGLRATDEVMLVTSELVSNAIIHGDDPLELHIDLDEGHLHLEVLDGGGHVPTEPFPMPDSHAQGGRGLPLVASVTDAWGSGLDPRGHTLVWADLTAPAAV